MINLTVLSQNTIILSSMPMLGEGEGVNIDAAETRYSHQVATDEDVCKPKLPTRYSATF